MTVFVVLLRAVNVGGTGKLPMSDLKSMCGKLGFTNVSTYIASGNVIFESGKSESTIKMALESALKRYAGKPVGVLVRTAAEMRKVLEDNPFPDRATNRTVVIFLDRRPPRDALSSITGAVDEEVHLGRREIYVHYPGGMARSKLRIPAVGAGTARNMNTVAKLVELAGSAVR